MLQIRTANDLLVAILGAVVLWSPSMIDPNDRPINLPTSALREEYDFVIVGGGTAGCVVANRLSERKDWNILLLEAGGDETLMSDIPLLYQALGHTLGTEHATVPQARACRAMNGSCILPRAYILGGCSTSNAMVYVRGNRHDYDHWAELGNKGWSYDEVLPYFLKSEDQRNDDYLSDKKHHSSGGPLTVSTTGYPSKLQKRFIEAGKELGYPERDINGEKQTGFMPYQATMRDGTRCSTAKAFLRPARNRTNLHVALNSFATRIVIDPETRKAIGVEFTRDGESHKVLAKREVVVSAGSVRSPQLLMLSGIGPRDQLEPFNISVVKELPGVGKNFQDHVGIFLEFRINESLAIGYEEVMNFGAVEEYAKRRKGPFSTFGVDAVAFVNAEGPRGDAADFPDVELVMVGKNGVVTHDSKPHTWTVFAGLTQSDSKGTVKLASSDAHQVPVIDPQFLSSDKDYAGFVGVIQTAMRLSETKPLSEIGSEFNSVRYRACADKQPKSLEQVKCLAENYSTTMHHLSGTCKMGPDSDEGSVVSDTLEVKGVKGLRVIDASVIPTIPRGNINAPVIMIAEKGADLIKESWK